MTHYPRGYIALISAIIISVVLLGLATAIGQSTFFSRFNALNREYKRISLGLAESCVHAALSKISKTTTTLSKATPTTMHTMTTQRLASSST